MLAKSGRVVQIAWQTLHSTIPESELEAGSPILTQLKRNPAVDIGPLETVMRNVVFLIRNA